LLRFSIVKHMSESMSKCYMFDERPSICDELETIYWSCLNPCTERMKGHVAKCSGECEKVAKYGMEKYDLTNEQALLCMHLSGSA